MKWLNFLKRYVYAFNIGKKNSLSLPKNTNYKKMQLKVKGENNSINIGNYGKIGELNIRIVGDNNFISVGDSFNCSGNCKIVIIGSNNRVILGNDINIITSLKIYNHDNSQDCSVCIGAKTSFYQTEIHNYDNKSSVIIGEDCMFAYDTIVYNTDGHAISCNGQLINHAGNLEIGNHVWCGRGSSILKKSQIADGSIVAMSAVVSGKFKESNCILAGIPAKQIKSNVYWDRKSVNQIVEDFDVERK